MEEQTLYFVYSVTFHVNPGRRVRTFWFLDREKAVRFYESVKRYPKVLDCRMFQTLISEATEYDEKLMERPILPVKI